MTSITKLKQQLTNKIKITATNVYNAATPKVQKKIDQIASAKMEDVLATATTIGTITFIIFSIVRNVNSASPSNRENSFTYNEVHITNNYYYGKDESK